MGDPEKRSGRELGNTVDRKSHASTSSTSAFTAVKKAPPSPLEKEKITNPHPSARPLRRGDLDGFWNEHRNKEIIHRGDYLVRNHLEVPPHIKAAYDIVASEGLNWCKVSEARICSIIDSLPRRLFESRTWGREDLIEPCQTTDPAYYEIMKRISLSEQDFYGIDKGAPAGKLLEHMREPASTPNSFKWHLKQAGVSIDRIFNFTNTVCEWTTTAAGKVEEVERTWPILQLQNQHRRKYFIKDMARYLRSRPNGHSELPHEVFFIPNAENRHQFLEDGVLKINARTLVLDTTQNNTLLKLMQEVDVKPGVIIKEFTFWGDGDDNARAVGEKQAPWNDFYDVPHWLRENYDVYFRHPGSGFVTCNPAIYIRKGKPSLLSRLAP